MGNAKITLSIHVPYQKSSDSIDRCSSSCFDTHNNIYIKKVFIVKVSCSTLKTVLSSFK